MDVPDDSVARLRIVAAAAVALVDKPDDKAIDVKTEVDAVFSVGEAFETPESTKHIERDLLAVSLLRHGGVERTMRAETPSLSGKKLTTAGRALCKTHGHLFKKRYRKRP
jgi:hypothetical protein